MRGRCTHRQIRIRLALTTQALRISPGAAERQVEVEVEVEAGVESGCKAQSSSPPPPNPRHSPLYFQSVGDILGATSPQISPTC